MEVSIALAIALGSVPPLLLLKVIASKNKRFCCVRQHEEVDCGAASFATVTKHYGLHLTLHQARELVGIGQQGTSFLGIRRGAEAMGFMAQAIRVPIPKIFSQIDRMPLPAIIHWRGYHFVVLLAKRGNRYVIADPGAGIRYLSQKELADNWHEGKTLLLEPTPDFRPGGEPKKSGFSQFVQRIWPYRAVIGQTFLFSITLGLLSLASPILIQVLTDDILVRGDNPLLNRMVIAVAVMNLVSSLLQLAQSNLIAHLAQRLELGLLLEFGRQILRLPLTYYETHRSGELISRVDDIQQVNQLIFQVIVGLPSQCFIGLLSLGLMLIYSWKLTCLALGVSVLMLLSALVLRGSLQQKTRRLLVEASENQGFLVELIKSSLTIKAIGAEPQLRDELRVRYGRVANLSLSTLQIGILNNSFSELVSGIGSITLLWFGSSLVMSNEKTLLGSVFTLGTLMAFNSMNGNFTGLVGTIVGLFDEHARAQIALRRLQEIIDHTPETEGDAGKQPVRLFGDDNVICRDVSFHHVGRREILEDISTHIPGGKSIALIGPSGCGKSTLAKLIAGMYPLQNGRIRIGVCDIRDLPLDCWRQQVVLVPQDAQFLSRSIFENFRLGAPYATLRQIQTACVLAGADEDDSPILYRGSSNEADTSSSGAFIPKLTDGYYTRLGEFGSNLSGGQRQRLALARAIVDEPPILILDESTSALDPASEAEVLDRLLMHRRGKTTIIISHRREAIRRAEWVVLMEEGKIKDQGPYREVAAAATGIHRNFFHAADFDDFEGGSYVFS